MRNTLKIRCSLLIFILFLGCTGNNDKRLETFFYKEYPTNPKKEINETLYIKGDTLFRYVDNYFFDKNELKYYLLKRKEKDSLKKMLGTISSTNVKPIYGDLDYMYSYNWVFNYENVQSTIICDTIPRLFQDVYKFLKEKTNPLSLTNISLESKSLFGEISIYNILNNKKELKFNTRIDKQLFLHRLWLQLINSTQRDLFAIDYESIKKFDYEIKYVFPENVTNKIEKILLNEENILAIKFIDSKLYKGIKLPANVRL